MRPTPLTARKAGAALAALMLSAALAACQPQISAAGAATPTSVPVPSDQTSTTAGGSHGGSTGGSTASSTDASQTSTPQGLESFYSQSIDWQDCSDGTSPFQCGTVTVPLDYNNPGGRTITIALKKLPASTPTPSRAPCSSIRAAPASAVSGHWRPGPLPCPRSSGPATTSSALIRAA